MIPMNEIKDCNLKLHEISPVIAVHVTMYDYSHHNFVYWKDRDILMAFCWKFIEVLSGLEDLLVALYDSKIRKKLAEHS